MSLNAYEAAIVAACAENYPKGHGESFFSDEEVDTFEYVVHRLKNDGLSCLEFG